jgi:hypothetical protein
MTTGDLTAYCCKCGAVHAFSCYEATQQMENPDPPKSAKPMTLEEQISEYLTHDLKNDSAEISLLRAAGFLLRARAERIIRQGKVIADLHARAERVIRQGKVIADLHARTINQKTTIADLTARVAELREYADVCLAKGKEGQQWKDALKASLRILKNSPLYSPMLYTDPADLRISREAMEKLGGEL